MQALVEIGTLAVEHLVTALQDKDHKVRSRAVQALGRIGDARSVKPLIAMLEDRDMYVRVFSAEALGKIGDERAVEPLITAIQDKDDGVRKAAAKTLVYLYNSGKLEDEHKHSILAISGTIIQPHRDHKWQSSEWSCDFHYDYEHHTDEAVIIFTL